MVPLLDIDFSGDVSHAVILLLLIVLVVLALVGRFVR